MSVCPTHKFAFSGKDGCQYCKNEEHQKELKEANVQIAVLVEGLKKVRAESKDFSISCTGDCDNIVDSLLNNLPEETTRLIDKLKRYKKALEFYAEESNYDLTEKYGEGAAAFKIAKIVEDNGKRARDSIESQEEA